MNTNEIIAVFRQHGDKKQRALITKLKKEGKKSLHQLQEIYYGQNPTSVKRWAIEALGSFPPSDVLKTLQSALKSSFMTIRLHAMIAIYHLGNHKNAKVIRPLLKDISGGIRLNALEILIEYKPKWLKSELKKMVIDEKVYIRNKAKKILELN